jgi:hypothetical protein
MRRRLTFAVLLAVAVAVPAAAQTPNPLPPVATTSAATSITLTSATVPGTVDANGSATTWHVEYGTTTAYGLKTAERDAGAGDAPVAVSAALTGLTSATTYHFRIVASNVAGIARSADRSLRTTAPPRPLPPLATTGPIQDLVPRAVTLTGSVDPRGTATRARFDWGTGTSLNRHTAYVAVGAGSGAVPAAATLALAPNTRYSYRVFATNAAGTAQGARLSFTTPRAPAVLSFALASNRVPYEGSAVVTGSATSAGEGGVPLVLERQAFPFSGPFEPIVRKSSARGGAYSFTVSPLLLSARLRVVAQTVPPVTSLARTVRTTVRVTIAAKRVAGRRVRFSGTVSPELSGARASLQRRKRGRFVTLRRVQLRPPGAATRSLYRMTISARRTAAYYRVVVTPLASSGHARGASELRHVAALKRR